MHIDIVLDKTSECPKNTYSWIINFDKKKSSDAYPKPNSQFNTHIFQNEYQVYLD